MSIVDCRLMVDGGRLSVDGGRLRTRRLVFAAVVALAGIGRASAADVIDRVMAVVNRQPILLSDVSAAMLLQLVPRPEAGDPLASTLERLIERSLILEEVERYQPPDPAPEEIEKRVDAIRQRFGTPDAFPKALTSVGMTDAQLRSHIRDDLRSVTYINQRFGESDPDARDTLVAEWVGSLRRRAEVTVLYVAKP